MSMYHYLMTTLGISYLHSFISSFLPIFTGSLHAVCRLTSLICHEISEKKQLISNVTQLILLPVLQFCL